jgi:hypothetical protein
VESDELVSSVNGKCYAIGELALPTLADLRDRVHASGLPRTTVGRIAADVRAALEAGTGRC